MAVVASNKLTGFKQTFTVVVLGCLLVTFCVAYPTEEEEEDKSEAHHHYEAVEVHQFPFWFVPPIGHGEISLYPYAIPSVKKGVGIAPPNVGIVPPNVEIVPPNVEISKIKVESEKE